MSCQLDTGTGGSVDGWKADDDAATATGWDGDAKKDGYGGVFSDGNVSRHAGRDDFRGGAADGGCRICSEDGHFARDCPNKPTGSGVCFRCGQVGHNKADCPEPEALPNCRVCGTEGHLAADCSANRLFAGLSLDDLSPDEAWQRLQRADKEKEVEDIKKAICVYAKAFPGLTLEELEATFRDTDMNTYLIAKQQDVSDTMTIVNLQGRPNQKYVVSFQFSPKPRRARFAEGWPTSPEENLTRLAEAGFVMDSMIPKCHNCGELGHTRAKCEQEKSEPVKPTITCSVCDGEGHRARDCTAERKTYTKKTCRNCSSEEHMAKDCDQERQMQCRNCDAFGHSAKECPEPKNMDKVQCRNCDEFGHTGRECPKPTDWSRVECSNCHEKGHSYKRCKAPPADDGGFGGAHHVGVGGTDAAPGWDGAGAGNNGGGGSGWEDTTAPVAASAGW